MRTLDELGISPAPWKVGTLGIPYAIMDADGEIVASMSANNKMLADARLIAAAPMLYEALEECERKLDACDPYCNLLEKVRRALSAASGESEVRDE